MLDKDILTAALNAPDRSRIEALVEGLIGYLDSLDTDPDLEEDDFGGGDVNDEPQGGDVVDEPHDGGDDDEGSLGWANNAGQGALGDNTEDGDETALERHGAGFLRSGGEDVEDDDPAEEDDPAEDGGEDEPDLNSFDRMMNQEKSWKQRFNSSNWHARNDAELDDADREDSDPAEDDGTAEDDSRRLPRVVWADTDQPVTFLLGR
jgi:hypothetical protein